MNSQDTKETVHDQADLGINHEIIAENQSVASPHQEITVEKQSIASPHQEIIAENQSIASSHQEIIAENQSIASPHQEIIAENQSVAEIRDVAHRNNEASLFEGFLQSLSSDQSSRDALVRSLGISTDLEAAMMTDQNVAIRWADEQMAQKEVNLARLNREREELLAQCDRARRDIDLACSTMTARLDNQCNELNARTMSAQDTQMSIFERKRAELQQQLDEMNMYQELASQLLNPSRSNAEVIQYAPVLMESIRASCAAATDDVSNVASVEAMGLEFIPAADVTGVNLLGTLVMSEREVVERSNDVLD